MGSSARSSSLPRTFQREALLRHPELSMEMDRLADPDILTSLNLEDQMSDSGATSAPESMLTARRRGYRSPSSFSNIGHDVYTRTERLSMSHLTGPKEIKRTPSTSAIYETLRRSKELRESLSRPSSRLSIDNSMDRHTRDLVRSGCGVDASFYSFQCFVSSRICSTFRIPSTDTVAREEICDASGIVPCLGPDSTLPD